MKMFIYNLYLNVLVFWLGGKMYLKVKNQVKIET